LEKAGQVFVRTHHTFRTDWPQPFSGDSGPTPITCERRPIMNTRILRNQWLHLLIWPLLLLACSGGHADVGIADSPRLADDQSPFVRLFAPGERETLLYVWTRDATGAGSDLIAVVDADPGSASFGQIVATAPTGSPNNEAHHFGYTERANRIFAGGIVSNRMFLYDVGADARQLRLSRTVNLSGTGYTGPHTAYAVPGDVLVTMMGGADGNGAGAIVELDAEGNVGSVLPAPMHEGRPVNL
jgi:hypothetical protein